MKERVGVIDLGSNTVRLLIFEINEDGSYRIINEVKETIRLSEKMGKDNLLNPDAMLRTMKVIDLFKRLCDISGVSTILAAATAAVRKAKNRDEFVTMLEHCTGIRFKVISGEREAELGYIGVKSTMDIEDGVIVDIGGASIEVTRFEKGKPNKSTSIPYGAVTLTEAFLSTDVNTPRQIEELEGFLRERFKELEWLKDAEELPLIGLGGTIRNLCKIDKVKKGYSLNSVHNYNMSGGELADIYDGIKFKSMSERVEVPGLSKERADIIIAGACAVNMLLQVMGSNRLIISGSGIREGLFYDYYFNAFKDRKNTDIRILSMENFMKLQHIDMQHAEHVSMLAMKLFDQLAPLHKLSGPYRDLFEKSAILHDAGVNIDFYNRDEHTYYLLTNSRLNGFSHKEIIMLALIASKFTGDKLKNHYIRHNDILGKADHKEIKKLIALLIICDKLDRSKSGVVKDLKCILLSNKVTIKAIIDGDGELEIAEAMKQAALFKKAFNRELVFL